MNRPLAMFRRTICRILPLAVLLAGTAPASADDGGMLYYSVGGHLLDTSALNSQIQTAGYKGFDNWTWGQGAGFYGIFKRVLVGLEFQSLFGQLSQSAEESLRLDGSYGMLQLGYAAVATPRFQVYPYIGLGYGAMNLRSSQALNSLLAVSQGSNQNLNALTAGNWLLDLGLGTTLTLPMSPDNPGDARGPSAALRAGWLFALGQTQWSGNDLPVKGGPALSPGGFYLRLMIGFGGYQ